MKVGELIRKRKYLFTLYMVITVTAIVLITIVLGSVYYSIRDALVTRERKISMDMLGKIQSSIDVMEQSSQNLSQAAFYNNDIKYLMFAKEGYGVDIIQSVNRAVDTLLAANPFIHSVYVYNSRQNRHYAIRNGANNLDEDFVALAEGGNLEGMHFPLTRSTGGQTVVTFKVADTNASKEQNNSAVYVNIRSEWFLNHIETVTRLEEETDNSLYVFDRQGRCINSQTDTQPMQDELHQLINWGSGNGAVDIMEITLEGEKYTATVLGVKNLEWTLVQIYPYQQFMVLLESIRVKMVLIDVISILLVLLLFVLLAWILYRPMGQLMKKVDWESGEHEPYRSEFDFLEQQHTLYNLSKSELKTLQQEADAYSRVVRDHLLRRLVLNSDEFTQEEERQLRKQFNSKLQLGRGLATMLIHVDSFASLPKEYSLEADIPLVLFGVLNVVKELFTERYDNECVHLEDKYIMVLYNITSGAPSDTAADIMERLHKVIQSIFSIPLSIAINESPKALTDIHHCYMQSQLAIRDKFMLGNGTTVDLRIFSKKKQLLMDYSFEEEEPFLHSLKRYELKPAGKVLHELMQKIRLLEFDSAYVAATHLTKSIQHTVYQMNRERSSPIPFKDWLRLWHQVPEITLFEYEDGVYRFLEGISAETIPPSLEHQVVAESMKGFIDQNYSDNALDVTLIADHLNISTTKASRSFNNHCDISIPEYINQLRLDKAMSWMQSSDLTIQEIMSKVGYTNEAYFYKVFKARFQSSPRAYMLALQKDEKS